MSNIYVDKIKVDNTTAHISDTGSLKSIRFFKENNSKEDTLSNENVNIEFENENIDFVDDFFTSEEKAKVVPLAIENLNEITNDELEKPEKVWLYVRVEKDNSSIDSVCKKISLSQLKDFIKS